MVASAGDESEPASGERPHVPPSKLHSIKDLSSIDTTTIGQLRTLDGYQRYAYMFELTDVTLHPYLDAFIREVIDKHGESKAWKQSVMLVPDRPLVALLREPLDAILSLLGSPESNWIQIEVNLEQWLSGFEYCGSPSVCREDLSYDWQPPENVGLIRAGALTTRKIENVRLVARRWLGSRVAFTAQHHGVELSAGAAALLGTAGVAVTEASPDALKAVEALTVEEQLGTDKGVPGFRAVDAVYLD